MSHNFPMKDNGMFILQKEDFDIIAEDVLMEYIPDTLKQPMPTNIEYLAEEGLFLNIEYDQLALNGEILGMMVFQDTMIPVYRRCHLEAKAVAAPTIVIDKSLLGYGKNGRRRFTLAHECGHYLTQRNHFDPQDNIVQLRTAENTSYIACRATNFEMWDKDAQRHDEHYWQEWQANSMSAALLMPRKTFIQAAEYVMDKMGVWQGCLYEHMFYEQARSVVRALADIFQVSQTSVRIRMKQFGLILA